MNAGVLRIVGFLVLVHGLGLRLDSSWQRVAWLLILAGGGAVAWALWREAFVSGPNEE